MALPSSRVLTMVVVSNSRGSSVLATCIFRVKFWKSCDQVLNKVEATLDDTTTPKGFTRIVQSALARIGAAGRQAGGANPPEDFQIYIGGCIPFFYEGEPGGPPDHGCDKVDWSWLKGQHGYLTYYLRNRMNRLTLKANSVIKAVVDDAAHASKVFYVDSHIPDYFTHTFCYPEPANFLADPITTETWFWAENSPYQDPDGGYEPPDKGSVVAAQNPQAFGQKVLDLLVPDQATQQTLTEEYVRDNFPAWYNGTWEDFAALIAHHEGDVDPDGGVPLSEQTIRMFHPKGTGYLHQASAFMDAIKANRGPVYVLDPATSSSISSSTPDPEPTPTPTPVQTDPGPQNPGLIDHPGAGSSGNVPTKFKLAKRDNSQ